MSSIFELHSDHILWRNNEVKTNIILSYPIMFPSNNIFVPQKTKIEDILIPDEIIKIFFDEKHFSIRKKRDHIVVTFYYKTNKRHLVFQDKVASVIINGHIIQNLRSPIVCTQSKEIYLLPFHVVMSNCRFYSIKYDFLHSKILLEDKMDYFNFKKERFPKIFPIPSL